MMTKTQAKYRKRVKALLDDRGMSQAELARKIGKSREAVNRDINTKHYRLVRRAIMEELGIS